MFYIWRKKRPETRARILETVLNLLLSQDKSALRMIDVAKAAGITRQTVYDHFSTRSEMLIAAILHFGDQMDVDALLADSRAARTGEARLAAYTRAVMVFFPRISPLHKALTRLGEADRDAKAAWARDGRLRPEWSEATARDYYFTLLSIDAWAHCVQDCGWSEDDYLAQVQRVTHEAFVSPA